jgi:23S rRNA (cytidine1920-2'-O)/16S rRNA (cytidine1409-2'-O)-methyltransferase
MSRHDAMRADVALVNRGAVRSRALAQRLIESGAVDVVIAGKPAPVSRCAQPVFPEQELRVKASPEARFVSRGGAKLEHALARAGIDCRGATALDVGMSTGGFTDCLLHHGAQKVIGIEVGHGQLDSRLAADERVSCFERTHVRDVTAGWLAGQGIDAAAFSLIVVDLSFISTVGLLQHLAALAAPGTTLLALIKPQFELGPDARNARGIVRADADIDALRERTWTGAQQAGWQPAHWFACGLQGTDGNQEYFLVATRDERTIVAAPTTPAAPATATAPTVPTQDHHERKQ